MHAADSGYPDRELVVRARRGEAEAFRTLTEPHRAALLALCYRMMGSPHDAEDQVQETMLRAWTRLGSFRGDSAVRTWLHRIAVNTCLDALRVKGRRVLPQSVGASVPGAVGGPLPSIELPWLGPMPGEWLDGVAGGPASAAARYEQRAVARIAFTAAMQHLPPRQRAVLLLRDVLGWRAREVAEALDTTEAAVNSALQRARVTLRTEFPDGAPEALPEGDAAQRALLERFVAAWESSDLRALLRLLREDAVLAMPPTIEWFRGRAEVAAFLRWAWGAEGPGPFRLLPCAANGEVSYALYAHPPGTTGYVGMAILVVGIEDAQIVSMTGFLDAELFPRFGLPRSLPDVVGRAPR